jgi:NAD-dependent deacetylase
MHQDFAMHSFDENINRVAEVLQNASRVVVLTGAGVSAESGVPTFRASDGLWEGHRIEDVATPFGWERDPKLVWTFYNERRVNVSKVKPNPGHEAIAQMEKRWGNQFAVVTQNVDGLHLLAGNKNVFEIHGSLRRTRCTECGEVQDRGLEHLGDLPRCPSCSGVLRPDIVWFHESLPEDVWQGAIEAVTRCEVLFVVGTSAVVYPAASLIPLAKRPASWDHVKKTTTVIEVNLTETEASHQVDIGLYGKSGEILPQIMEKLK